MQSFATQVLKLSSINHLFWNIQSPCTRGIAPHKIRTMMGDKNTWQGRIRVFNKHCHWLLAFLYGTRTIVLMVNQANILLWQTLVLCCLPDRRWQQCRNQNRLALLLIIMTSDITRYCTWYSISGCSVNLTCISETKVTATLFTIISGGRKIWRHDRPRYSRFAL